MDANGSLATLRHGFKCYGRTLRVAFFKPAHGMNPELEKRYKANRLGLTRQLHFSPKNEKSLDVTLSVNGIPVTTLELKNQLTNQTVEDAMRQYRVDRDPREVIFEFKRRTIGWLAHRLASLHDVKDQRVFGSVIVVTDRIVLDQQLQDTIYQFEHRQGVVQKDDPNVERKKAALALARIHWSLDRSCKDAALRSRRCKAPITRKAGWPVRATSRRAAANGACAPDRRVANKPRV